MPCRWARWWRQRSRWCSRSSDFVLSVTVSFYWCGGGYILDSIEGICICRRTSSYHGGVVFGWWYLNSNALASWCLSFTQKIIFTSLSIIYKQINDALLWTEATDISNPSESWGAWHAHSNENLHRWPRCWQRSEQLYANVCFFVCYLLTFTPLPLSHFIYWQRHTTYSLHL